MGGCVWGSKSVRKNRPRLLGTHLLRRRVRQCQRLLERNREMPTCKTVSRGPERGLVQVYYPQKQNPKKHTHPHHQQTKTTTPQKPTTREKTYNPPKKHKTLWHTQHTKQKKRGSQERCGALSSARFWEKERGSNKGGRRKRGLPRGGPQKGLKPGRGKGLPRNRKKRGGGRRDPQLKKEGAEALAQE